MVVQGTDPASFENITDLINKQRDTRQNRNNHATFLDIASAQGITAEANKANEAAIAALARRPQTSVLAHNVSSCSAALLDTSDAALVPGTGQADAHVQGELPMDWSLKRSLKISTNVPLEVLSLCLQGPVAGGAAEATDMMHYTPTRCQESVASAMSWWQHPVEALPANGVTALQQAGLTHLLQARKASHREALHQLYYAVRRDRVFSFFYLLPSAARKPLCIAFRSAGTAGYAQIHALISHSSKGLRRMLRSLQPPVHFSMPWLAHRGMYLDEDNPVAGKTEIDDTPRSLLLVHGPRNTHALFDFLINDAEAKLLPGCDVPLLLAPEPFQGSACVQPTVKVTARTALDCGSGSTAALARVEAVAPQYSAIPPWAVEKLLHSVPQLLARGHEVVPDAEVSVHMEQHPLSMAFNVQPGAKNAAKDAMDMDEMPCGLHQRAAGCCGEVLGGAVVRRVHWKDGRQTSQLVHSKVS